MKRGYCCVALEQPKYDSNVGGAIRAAGCYSADLITVSGRRFKNEPTDTQKAYRHIPLIRSASTVLDSIPYDCVPVAVEIHPKAVSLFNFVHPERAYYIFGSEDGTLPERVIDACRNVIYVPTNYCMNLAATVNVVLYDRNAKLNNKLGVA